MKLKKNKKGTSSTEISLIQILEVFLAVIVVLFLIYIGYRLSNLFTSNQEYDAAVNNLDELNKKITDMMRDPRGSETSNVAVLKDTMIYELPDDYILVGFNYQDNSQMLSYCTIEGEKPEPIDKSRPKACEKFSCLCLYNNYHAVGSGAGGIYDFDKHEPMAAPVKCKKFAEKIVFLSLALGKSGHFYGSKTDWKLPYETSRQNYFVTLYGQCDLELEWSNRRIYIEKFKDKNDIYYIGFGDMKDPDVISRNQRIETPMSARNYVNTTPS
ncbi:MAG TPA: hypothetical protein VI564_07385 [Candidatus Nanoarchaeia archaeon]|nr:hypothetical protein [Candidatus Nanoarchaeia archaeon]